MLGDRYLLRQRIGGEASRVWRADDTLHRQTVAVKVADRHGDAAAVARFAAQASALHHLDHPSVIRVVDYGKHHALAYMVMPFVLGEPLRALLQRGGRLDAERAMLLVAEVAEALHAAATVGVGHADLSPSDVILRLDGSVVVTGFGGTAPDATLLVRALGMLAWECITGALGADGADPSGESAAPESVRVVIGRALSHDPAIRWPDPLSLATAARHAVGKAVPPAPTPTVAPTRSTAPPPVRVQPLPSKSPAPSPPPADRASAGRSSADRAPGERAPGERAPAGRAPAESAPSPLLDAPMRSPTPTTTMPVVSGPPRRQRTAAGRPLVVAAMVTAVLAAAYGGASLMGLSPWTNIWPRAAVTDAAPATTFVSTPSTSPERTSSPSSSAPATTPAPTTTAAPTTTPAPAPPPPASPNQPSSGGQAPSTAPGPATFRYKVAAGQLGPLGVDGDCVFRVWYGNYGSVAFAKIRLFAGNCGSPSTAVAAQRGDVMTYQSDEPGVSGGSDGCGSYFEIQVIAGGDPAFGVGMRITFPQTGNTYIYHHVDGGAQPVYRSC